MRKTKMNAAFLLSISLSLGLLAGCGNNTDLTTKTSSASTVYGIVREVDEDSVTIEEGTLKERPERHSDDQQKDQSSQTSEGGSEDNQQGQPPQPTQGGSGDNQQGQPPQPPQGGSGDNQQGRSPQGMPGKGRQGQAGGGQGGPSGEDMLDLSGEEKEISVTADTQVTSGRLPMGGKDAGSDGEAEPASGEMGGQESGDSANTDQSQDSASQDKQSEDQDAANQDKQSQNQEAATGKADTDNNDNNEDAIDEVSDLKEGDLVSIELDAEGNAKTITVMNGGGHGGPNGSGQGMPGGQSSQPDSYTAVTSYDENATSKDETYTSTGTDENAALIDKGAEVTLDNPTVTRTSDDSSGGDSASFYGVGAAVLNKEGKAYIKNGTINTDAAGGAGIFSYGDQSVTYVSGTRITTKEGTSGGIHVAGGGTLYAWDVTAETSGESSAAIRSDRGGGTMVIDGGSYTSNGTGSPAVYTTADITVNKAKMTANKSEAVCIEGLNSLRLYDTTVTGNMPDQDQNDCTWNVILYQSMSGDSEEGNSSFDMEGGKLTAKNGGMFYTTNTESTFVLNDVDIEYADQNDFFLKCTGNSNARGWGSTGQNGAKCTFTGIDQDMEGDVIWDSISSLNMYLTQGSSLKGAVIDDESNAGDSRGSGYCNLIISKDSTWTVTGDSTLTSLSSQGKIVDEEGKTVTIKGSDGTVYVSGNSRYTVTVEEYQDTADVSGASKASSYSDYKVEKPEALQ